MREAVEHWIRNDISKHDDRDIERAKAHTRFARQGKHENAMNERFSPINYTFRAQYSGGANFLSPNHAHTCAGGWALRFHLFRCREVCWNTLFPSSLSHGFSPLVWSWSSSRHCNAFPHFLLSINLNFGPANWLVDLFENLYLLGAAAAIVLLLLLFPPNGRIQRKRTVRFHHGHACMQRGDCAGTYLLSFIGGSGNNKMPSWNHSIFSSPVPVMEQLKMAVPPELTICTCGWMWTERYVFTCKRISTRCSPNWFDALHTYSARQHATRKRTNYYMRKIHFLLIR